MHVELRAEARDDIYHAAAFYNEQCQGLGQEFVETIFSDLITLERQAGVHPTIAGCHRKLTTRFPFGIYYRVLDSVIDVVAVLDCRQNPETRNQRLRDANAEHANNN